MLRPGNAAPNDTDDHLELLEQVVRIVPAEYPLGHEEGDDPAMVLHPILVRADSAGATHRFVASLSDANFDYSIGFPISGSVRDALLLAQEEDWVRAIELDGGIRDGAEVIELTELYEVEPAGRDDMRLICRRERPHPGAQLSLFDTHAGWRHTCFITNTVGDDIAALELRHRGHARVEDRVRVWKACGLANLPFEGFCANEAWVAVSLLAGALLAWSQMTCFDGALAKAEPKTHALPGPPCRRGPRPPWTQSGRASRRDLALDQRTRHRLHPSTRRVPITGRVPASDPESNPAGRDITRSSERRRCVTPMVHPRGHQRVNESK